MGWVWSLCLRMLAVLPYNRYWHQQPALGNLISTDCPTGSSLGSTNKRCRQEIRWRSWGNHSLPASSQFEKWQLSSIAGFLSLSSIGTWGWIIPCVCWGRGEGRVLCIVGCFTACLTVVHKMTVVPSLSCDQKNISRQCQRPLGGKTAPSWESLFSSL